MCPDHGVEGVLDVVYDYDLIRRRVTPESVRDGAGMWRFRGLLPVETETPVPPLLVGDTPIVDAPDWRPPSGVARGGSRTRAAAHGVAQGPGLGDGGGQGCGAGCRDHHHRQHRERRRRPRRDVCCIRGAGRDLRARLGSPAKLAQLHAFGAAVVLVEGSYDQAVLLSMAAAERRGWYNRNTGFNPYLTEGKKTVVYEICEALGWQAPDVITVGVGDGCIIGGLHKGLRDLFAMGWIDRMPRLVGVRRRGAPFSPMPGASGRTSLPSRRSRPTPWPTASPPAFPRPGEGDGGGPRHRGRVRHRERRRDPGRHSRRCPGVRGVRGAGGGGIVGRAGGPGAIPGWWGSGDRVVIMNTGSGLKDVARSVARRRGGGNHRGPGAPRRAGSG